MAWFTIIDVRCKKYFVIPAITITKTEQKSVENGWKAQKDLCDNFENVVSALCAFFKRIIEPAYHSGGTGAGGLARRGFGNDDPPDILSRLQRLYSKPPPAELD